MTGFYYISRLLYNDDYKEIHYQTHLAADQVAIRLEEGINSHLAIVRYLQQEWNNGYINTRSTFTQRVETILGQFGGFQAINYIDSVGIIQWVVPQLENQAALGRDLHDHPSAAETFITVEKTRQSIATPPVTLWQGGVGIATYFPLEKNNQPDGYLNGVFKIEHFINYSLGQILKEKFYVTIRDEENIFYSTLEKTDFEKLIRCDDQSIAVMDREWTLVLAAHPLWFISIDRPKYLIVLIIGFFVAISIGWFTRVLMLRRSELHFNIKMLKESQKNLQSKTDQQDRLLEIARQLTANLELKSVLKQIGVKANDLLQSYSCVIYLVNEEDQILEPVVAVDPEYEKEILATKIEITGSYSGKALRAKSCLIFNSVKGGGGGYQIPGTRVEENERIVVAPFIVDDEAIGVMCLNRMGKPFNEDDQRLVETFAIYASTVIQNAQTYDHLLQEIKERTDVQNQLKQAQKMEAIGQLAGGVAHDFNNKLGGIMGYAELALYDVENQELVANNLKNIIDRCEKAALLVQQLLAFSRQQVLNPKTINLNKVAFNSVNLLENVIGENIILDVKLEPDLKTIIADLTALDQIILNLCINARDAMPNGGQLTIRTENVELNQDYLNDQIDLFPGDYVSLVISDTGTGIDPDIQARIFDPFFSTKDIDEGTGLGLSMVFGLVKQHKGYIECKSNVGIGTSFSIYFPVGKSDVAAKIKTEGKSLVTNIQGGGETILLVEDDKNLLDIVSTTLSIIGYQVLIAENGHMGLSIYSEKNSLIDLIISDVVMPGMSGMGLYNDIISRNPQQKFLFITGYGPESILVKQSSESGIEILQKPFRKNDLAVKVREILKK